MHVHCELTTVECREPLLELCSGDNGSRLLNIEGKCSHVRAKTGRISGPFTRLLVGAPQLLAHGEHEAEQEYNLAEPHAHFSSTLQKVVAHPLPKGVPQLFANEMACQCFQSKSYDVPENSHE